MLPVLYLAALIGCAAAVLLMILLLLLKKKAWVPLLLYALCIALLLGAGVMFPDSLQTAQEIFTDRKSELHAYTPPASPQPVSQSVPQQPLTADEPENLDEDTPDEETDGNDAKPAVKSTKKTSKAKTDASGSSSGSTDEGNAAPETQPPLESEFIVSTPEGTQLDPQSAGLSLDGPGPVISHEDDAAKDGLPEEPSISGQGTAFDKTPAYWAASGSQYHLRQDCKTLKDALANSWLVSGTLSDAINSGHDRPCAECG